MTRKTCEFEGCSGEVHGRGVCSPHYRQLRLANWDKAQVRPLRTRESVAGVCKFPECGREKVSRGYCGTHYTNLRNARWDEGRLKPISEQRGPRGGKGDCSFEGCGRKQDSRGLCNTHYRMDRAGQPLKPIQDRTYYTRDDKCYTPRCGKKPKARGLCSKHYKLVSEYGLTRDRILDMFEDATCKICGTTPEGRDLHIDHDHGCCPGNTSCGECVRGILCNGCNTAIGLFKGSIPAMKSAIKYLEKR